MGQEHVRKIPCTWWETAGKINRYLRRYCPDKCPGVYGFHNAHTLLDTLASSNRLDDKNRISGDLHPHSDLRWPTKCDGCDYVFKPSDTWQRCMEDIYRCVATGEEQEQENMPYGAISNAWWMVEDDTDWAGPDGLSLAIVVPGGSRLGTPAIWHPDVPHRGGTPWQRVGDPRNPLSLSIVPSILVTSTPKFHAYLTQGYLSVLPDSEC